MQPQVAALVAALVAAGVASAGGDADLPGSAPPTSPAATRPAEDVVSFPATLLAGPDVLDVFVADGELRELRALLGEHERSFPEHPGDEILGVIEPPLPPAPRLVDRVTRYYGTVPIDHEAHLARRITCKECHGPGRVTGLVFTPKMAHERCIGCHQQIARGPDTCKGCHVKPAPEPEQLAAATAASPPKPPEPNPENVAAALAAFAAPAPLARSATFQRHLELGFAAGKGGGFAVRLASRQDRYVFSQSVEQLRASDAARTLALLGAGLSYPVNPATFIETAALAGVDVFDRPVVAVFPAIGARLSVEWRQPTPFLQNLTASVTATTDLGQTAFGRRIGGVAIYGGVATGFRVP